MVIRIMLNPESVDMEGVTTLAQAQAANEQLKQGIEERNRQAIAAWETRTGLKYDPEWREHVLRPDGPFRESTGSYIREGTIRNGEWNGEVREYKDGVLRKISNYKNGWESLARKLYREDGTLALDRSLNEDGNIVDVHYGEDGKTEDYRLVLDRHRKVLFDSRNQPQEAPAEPAAQPEPEQKPSAKMKAFERVREPLGSQGGYMEGTKENGHWVGEVRFFITGKDKLPAMIEHYDSSGRLEIRETMHSTDRSKVYLRTYFYADGSSIQTMYAPSGEALLKTSIDANGHEEIIYSRAQERLRRRIEEAKDNKYFPKESIDWELLMSDKEGMQLADDLLFYVEDRERQDDMMRFLGKDKKEHENAQKRAQAKLREAKKKALALQEELRKRRGQPEQAADSWEGKTIEAIVQDIRAIRATPRADHTSPLLKLGATQQKDGTVLHVKPESWGRDVRVYRTNKNGEKVGEEKAFRRIWNDAVTGKPEFDDFLTLHESTRYDDNGNPVESLSYDPDGRIHGRERFRSWRDENGEWHTKSVDSFVIDEDGVYITREGVPTEHLPLDVLDESRGQAGNTALSVGDGAYLDAVRRGDMGAARRMVEERATEMGIENPIPEQTDAYKVRVSAPPKKTIKVYKVFTIDQAGRPTALFVSGMDALPMGVWLDAQDTWHFTAKNGKQYVPSTANPNGRGGKTGAAVEIPNEATRQELIKRGFLPQGSKAKTVVALAYRPGWHAGDMPFFPQGGVRRAGSNYGNVHHARQVVFECEMDADHDYTDEARRQPKALTKDGRVNEANADLQSMPEGGFYRYSTNPLTKGGKRGTWFISGSLKINRALTQGEADGILRENGFAPQEWEQGALDLAQLGYRGDESEAARKTLAPVTYDDNGNVIPLSQRFNPANPDIRLSVGSRMGRWDDKRVGTIDRINREALKRDLEMPVPFAGSKRTILNEHPEFFKAVGEAAIRNGGKVIDAFAGAGTYTAGLGQLGALPKGSVLNEWSAARYVMHKMLAERPEAMARAAEKLVTRFANSPEVAEVRRRVAQANKDGQHVVNINQPVIDWFYDELNGKHGTVYVDGTGNTEYGDAALRATPESAALYHVLQSIMSGGFPVNFVWKNGELKIDVAGGNFRSGQVGRIAEKNAKTNMWRIGVSVFNPEHYTKRIRETGRIYREAGVKVTRGDGWALVKTAKRGDVVFVDPAYLGTQSYGGKKNVDANDANDPEIAIGRLVDLVNWADANGVSVVYTNEFSDKSAMGGMSQEDYAQVWEEARERIGADKVRVGYVERGAQGFGKRGGGRADVIFVSGAAMEALDKAREQSGNTALSVGERPGRAPSVEPGGDVREAGEGALAWLRRKFVHSQTPVFDAVRRVMGVGREPPDALNVEAAAKNVHGKIRARQEMLQRAYLEPLKAILAQPGLDRKRFDDYALALHALERNRMIQERSVVVDPTTGEVVDFGVEAGSGVTNAWAERVIREIQRDPFAAQYKEAANILAEMNRFVLRGAVADGLLTEAQARTWMRLSPHYVPLKSGGAAPGAIHKRATGRFTRPDSVLVNSMRQAYATVRNGELNRVNKTMADWIREYDPNGEQVGGTVPESHKHAKIKMTDPQYVPKGSTAEALLRERGIRLVETEDKGGYWVDTGVLPNALKRVVRESVPQGDDIVTFWENGERKFIRFEGKRGRDGRAENEAARIADALNFKNVLHKEGKFWDAIRGLTRWKANVSTSWNPTFIVRNMGADVFNTANLMMIEGKYAELARTMRNYPEALRTIARLHSLRREAGDSKMGMSLSRCFWVIFYWRLCADCAPLTCLYFCCLL